MREELLHPLSRGNLAQYQRYDWGLNHLADWIDVPAFGIVLVDGVYSYRPELRGLYDFSIFGVWVLVYVFVRKKWDLNSGHECTLGVRT